MIRCLGNKTGLNQNEMSKTLMNNVIERYVPSYDSGYVKMENGDIIMTKRVWFIGADNMLFYI